MQEIQAFGIGKSKVDKNTGLKN